MAGYPTFTCTIEDDDAAWQRLVKRLGLEATWGNSSVDVGVMDDGGPGSQDRDGITNAELMAVHEFGTEDGHIPERKPLRHTFDVKKEEYFADLKAGAGAVIDGDASLPEILAQLGERMVNDVTHYVLSEGAEPANAEETIQRKLGGGALTPGFTREGSRFRSSKTGRFAAGAATVKPLVDTGKMLASLTWRVIKGAREG